MNDDENLPPVPAYPSELEEGEIREFKPISKTSMTVPLPLSPIDSPVIPPTPVPSPMLNPPEPILEDFTIEPITFCGCSRRRRRKTNTNTWLHYLYALF